MQSNTRPGVRWADNSDCALARTVAKATMTTGPARCDDVWFDSTGYVTVGWHEGRISNTGLGLGLAQWKMWLWTSSIKDDKAIASERVWFDAQIAAAGL